MTGLDVATGLSGDVILGGAEDPSLPEGFASSSAIMRRIDAKISSIEGSWTFAGCVISDSTSPTPSSAFYTRRHWICRSGHSRPGFSPRRPDLSPSSTTRKSRWIRLPQGLPRRGCKLRHESLYFPRERYVMATIDCKQHALRMVRNAELSLHTGARRCPPAVPNEDVRLYVRDFPRADPKSDGGPVLSGHQACGLPPSCRGPVGNARWDRRWW